MADEMIKVYGLRELNRALKRLDEELPKHVRGRLKAIASRAADRIRPRLPFITGNLQRKLRARATRTGASVVSVAEYAGANEFGGWPKGREFVSRGRYILPAVEGMRSEIEEELVQELNDVIDEAGLA